MTLLFFVFCSIQSCSVDETTNKDNSIDLSLAHKNDWVMSDAILSLINQHRLDLNKAVLVKDTLYATAYSVDHTLSMIQMGQVNHNSFFIRSNGLKSKGAIRVSENVAYGYSSAQSVVNAWLKSESHRKIIEKDFTHVGFGVLKSPNNKYYYTTLFYR